jgi:hypothetical protein
MLEEPRKKLVQRFMMACCAVRLGQQPLSANSFYGAKFNVFGDEIR